MMPWRVARFVPDRNATGAAMSSGHGVASTSTCANRVPSPLTAQAVPAISRDTTVNGTDHRSARRTNSGRLSAAPRTRSTICWYWDRAAVAVARTRTRSAPTTEPDSTPSPSVRVTGSGSPVSEDSSNTPDADASVPSTGTTSPGRTTTTSPTRTSAAGTRRSEPPSSSVASWGAPASRASSSADARAPA